MFEMLARAQISEVTQSILARLSLPNTTSTVSVVLSTHEQQPTPQIPAQRASTCVRLLTHFPMYLKREWQARCRLFWNVCIKIYIDIKSLTLTLSPSLCGQTDVIINSSLPIYLNYSCIHTFMQPLLSLSNVYGCMYVCMCAYVY